MALLVISFLAGALTVLAPCILPLLPVVIGGAAAGVRRRTAPFWIIGSLALSIILFTYLLKASTALLTIPPAFWTYFSGGILFFFGLTLLFPALWEKIPGINRLSAKSNIMLGQGAQRRSIWGDVIVGASLGPIFSTCSPTYFVILANVLPESFARGTIYLLSYVLGLSLVLLAIAFLGQRLAGRLGKAADPHGWLKRGLGVLFVILGALIALGYEKKLEVAILDAGYFDVTKIEQRLLKSAETASETDKKKVSGAPRYQEITSPSGFINTDAIRIGDLIGKKVVLVDIWTYSCINCQRTLPYLNAWYDKYRDQGLEIIGVHSPEFAFERDINNVRKAVETYGIKYPVVLDNDFGTWRAYGNQYWPRKYLIDINGDIVYDHAGEGAYDETEQKIQELLQERKAVLGMNEVISTDMTRPADAVGVDFVRIASPETYFGSARNNLYSNRLQKLTGKQTLTLPQAEELKANQLYLVGDWDISEEYSQSLTAGATVVYRYNAKSVYMVAEADQEVNVRVKKDGVLVRTVMVKDSTLYTLIEDNEYGAHEMVLEIMSPGLRAYTFTFG